MFKIMISPKSYYHRNHFYQEILTICNLFLEFSVITLFISRFMNCSIKALVSVFSLFIAVAIDVAIVFSICVFILSI